MAEKLDLDALEQECDPFVALTMSEAYYQRRILELIASIRELEARSERQSMLLRDQTDRLGAANLRVIELERASQPGSDYDPIAGADSETTVDMPCPFCGGEGYLMKDGPHHWVECSQCFCETTRCQSPSGNDEAAARRAIQLWEQRYGRDGQPGSGVAEMEAFEKAFPMPRDCIRCGTGYAATAYNAWTAHEYCRKWEGWKARASLDGRRED